MTRPMPLGQNPVSERIDWATPPEVFDPLNAEFGFTLDVCALPHNAKCPVYFTPDDDGVTQDWGRNVCWMNPPYGKEIARWMRKAYQASQQGATVVCLIPSRTDAHWWHNHAMKGEIRYVRGRIRFVGAPYTAAFPSAIVVFRPVLARETGCAELIADADLSPIRCCAVCHTADELAPEKFNGRTYQRVCCSVAVASALSNTEGAA